MHGSFTAASNPCLVSPCRLFRTLPILLYLPALLTVHWQMSASSSRTFRSTRSLSSRSASSEAPTLPGGDEKVVACKVAGAEGCQARRVRRRRCRRCCRTKAPAWLALRVQDGPLV